MKIIIAFLFMLSTSVNALQIYEIEYEEGGVQDNSFFVFSDTIKNAVDCFLHEHPKRKVSNVTLAYKDFKGCNKKDLWGSSLFMVEWVTRGGMVQLEHMVAKDVSGAINCMSKGQQQGSTITKVEEIVNFIVKCDSKLVKRSNRNRK